LPEIEQFVSPVKKKVIDEDFQQL